MATSVNFPTYGFINDLLALNEENWRRFFKPFINDSVQSGLVVSEGTGMTVNVSAGECRCGAVMGILDGTITLDVANGHTTYNRIDSVVVQYTYNDPSTLSIAIVQGTPASTAVPPTLSKVFNTLWQMEIARILVTPNATESNSLTITDKRVIYNSIQSLIDDTAGVGETDKVWSANKITTTCLMYKGILDPTTDIDTVKEMGIYAVSSSNTSPNKPLTSGFLIVIIYKSSTGTSLYALQIFSNLRGNTITTRRCTLNTDVWTEWYKIVDYDNYQYIIRSKSLATDFTSSANWDNVKTLGTYYVATPNSYINAPEYTAGILYVIVSGSIVIQHFITVSGNHYVRHFNSTWKSWKVINSPHNRNAKYYAFGDSVVKGSIGGNTSETSNNNYPASIGKLLGIQVINKAVGGQGLITDWNYIHDNYIDDEVLDMSDANLITVGWAYNDSSSYPNMNFGSYTDTSDDTFIGKYYTIMKEFQQKCPTAQVILITGYGSPSAVDGHATLSNQFTHQYTFADRNISTGDMYDELEKMANLNGWPCVNQHKGCAFNKFKTDLIGDNIHPTDEGYIAYSNVIAARVAQLYCNIRAS